MCSASKLYKFSHIKLLCIKASESTPPQEYFHYQCPGKQIKRKNIRKTQTALFKVVEEKTREQM